MDNVVKNDMFRLAAVLYADNNYEVSQKTIHKKIVESALLENSNRELTIDEAIDWIESKYGFIFTEDEIASISGDDKSFIATNKKGTMWIQLTAARLLTLENKIQNNNIEYFIERFLNTHPDYSRFDAKAVIYKFLYEIFNINIASFTKLLDYKQDIGAIKNLEADKFNDIEKRLINVFLQWENDGKNKAIFDISSYALEYCLITNTSKSKQIHLDNLRKKTFYLDTNIIFRALGINGENRQARTTTFLKKFNEVNETLLISRFTDLEFTATVRFYVDKFGKNYSPKINSNLYKNYIHQSDFYQYYHAWRAGRQNDNLQLFEAHILSKYETFKKNFEIGIDYVIPFPEKDDKVNEEIEELSRDIYSFKSREGNGNGFETSNWDAKNIYLLEKKRKGQNTNIFETKYFFISSDQGLRRWDYQRNHATPTVLLPSQWLSILLRYVNRTSDDFKSFVSFLNLPQNEAHISSENFHLVLLGIGEITDDVAQQSTIIEVMISNKFKGVIGNGLSDEQIIQNSTKIAKSILEDELKRVQSDHQKLGRKLEDHIESSKLAIGQLREQREEEKRKNTIAAEHIADANSVINAQGAQNAFLKEELKRKHVSKQIIYWRIPAYLLLLVGAFIIVSCCLLFCFTTSWYNYSYAFASWVNKFPDNTMQKAILIAGITSSLGLLVWIATFSFNRLWNKEKKAKKLESILLLMPEKYK
jgi:hypothetical protein